MARRGALGSQPAPLGPQTSSFQACGGSEPVDARVAAAHWHTRPLLPGDGELGMGVRACRDPLPEERSWPGCPPCTAGLGLRCWMSTQWGESSGSGPSSVPLPAWPSGLAQTYLVIPQRLHNLGNVEQDGVLWGAGCSCDSRAGVPGAQLPGPASSSTRLPPWCVPECPPPHRSGAAPRPTPVVCPRVPPTPPQWGSPEAHPAAGLTGGKDLRTLTPYCAVRGCGGYMLEK